MINQASSPIFVMFDSDFKLERLVDFTSKSRVKSWMPATNDSPAKLHL